MAGTIQISTDQVESIASSMESLNNKLYDTLQESRTTIRSLSSTWTGEGATATINAYNTFAETYFQTYYDVIKAYVTFLRQSVSADYQTTETNIVSLADAFL